MTAIVLIVCALAGYLLGSVNCGIIMTRLFSKKDIRTQGSGNAGMTNVLRSVGKLPALLTFIGDFLKCVVAVLLAGVILRLFGLSGEIYAYSMVWKAAQLCAGTACVLGHNFPVYYGFRGGKGIVCSAAMMAIFDWRVFVIILATFGIVFFCKFIISLASVVCAAMYPVYTFLLCYFLDFSGSPLASHADCSVGYLVMVTLAAVFLGGLALFMHRANIGRLIRGEEKPIKAKKR